jgi:hypothetical protein
MPPNMLGRGALIGAGVGRAGLMGVLGATGDVGREGAGGE